MIDRKQLLDDLKSFLKTLEADLLARSESDEVPEVRAALTAEFQTAKKAERTALNYEDWRSAYITQMAAAWVLTCVFTRFIEDNQLVESPMIAGPGDRLEHARNDHQVYFTNHPTETDREYLLHVFDTLRDLGGGAVQDVFGPHNVLRQLPNWLSGDAAGDLLEFFRKIDPNTGQIVHDFTDPDWNTRFLGDLYQDLSEAARKKYALLQTPDFVEEFILDRTLEPALDEFGLRPETAENNLFKMIDPACGSGHFLLGSFPRILKRWQEKEPGTNKRDLIQRTLDSIHGVDINPFAIAIARFRLLLVSLQASGITRLADAPAFAMNLACGDSLYHGVAKQQTMDFTDEAHYFKTEDAEELRRILQEGTFHAVVANPPYITPKDKAANEAYRRLYSSCHRQYSLSVPFLERIFRLCVGPAANPGFTGQITANSFMKREFGKKLIEEFMPTITLTHMIDTSGAYIPGHSTPTVILLGRNQKPLSETIRAVMGKKGEPTTPKVPSEGHVWKEIVTFIDVESDVTKFISVANSERTKFYTHPWCVGGGGAAELKTKIEDNAEQVLGDFAKEIGYQIITGDDNVYLVDSQVPKRYRIKQFLPFADGESVRDWFVDSANVVLWPNNRDGERLKKTQFPELLRLLWPRRITLKSRKAFGVPIEHKGIPWWSIREVYHSKITPHTCITFSEVSTHTHFVCESNNRLFNQTAPVIVLKKGDASSENYLLVESLLNSSATCFWLKQVCFPKKGHLDSKWEERIAFNTTNISKTPLPSLDLMTSRPIRSLAKSREDLITSVVEKSDNELRPEFSECKSRFDQMFDHMVGHQEELDWECYQAFGILAENLSYTGDTPQRIRLGERAFEILMARQIAEGKLKTTWFEKHRSAPITELPEHWPEDYKQLVQRRIDVIESNKNIALIEQPEYKRRWNTEPWEEQVEKALNSWLLDRLESYFDFDGRMLAEPNDDESGEENPPVKHKLYGILGDAESPSLVSVAQLADVAAQDEQFMEVAEVYKDDPAFDVQRLVEDLVKPEQVPILPILRYKPAGLRKRVEWEKTWDLQRLEDAARAGTSMSDPAVTRLIQRCEIKPETIQQIEAWQQRTPESEISDTTLPSARELDAILSIPVPPKYKSSDMINTGGAKYWKLRGKLDVPKERWISFPHCEGTDGTLMLAWAGYDQLQVARAISGHYIDVRDNIGGSDDPRLVPLLAGIMELLPWLHQWHSEIDPEFDMRMNEYYETFVNTGAADAGLSREDIPAWEPPAKVRKKKATKKKPKEKQQELDV